MTKSRFALCEDLAWQYPEPKSPSGERKVETLPEACAVANSIWQRSDLSDNELPDYCAILDFEADTSDSPDSTHIHRFAVATYAEKGQWKHGDGYYGRIGDLVNIESSIEYFAKFKQGSPDDTDDQSTTPICPET